MKKRVGVTYSNPEKLKPYLDALEQAGLDPVPLHASQSYSLDGLDGLLISGGTDVDPALYGQQPHQTNENPDRERDQMETALLQQALAQDRPVLAICRGMQLFNVAHSGTLVQHVDGHRKPGVDEAHDVEVKPETRLARILGAGPHPVNSRHHQVVDQVGDGLVVAATSERYVEALERPDRRFALAVQWHPEDLVGKHEESKRLFRAFADAL
jgi:putative glutamine amidotransferase